MYLWGWPAQQLLRASVGPDWSGYAFFLLSIPDVVFACYASWNLVEWPFVTRRLSSIQSLP